MRTARQTAVATTLVLAAAGELLATAPTASAAVTCASPLFKREYFANTTFTGTPKRVDCDSAVAESWTGAPAYGLPRDRFGVRWTVTRDFGSGGPFALSVAARDGVRVYLDGVRKYSVWTDLATVRAGTVNLTIPQGRHTLRVDFANWTGTADVKFSYLPRTAATVDKVRPLTPAGFAVAYDRTTGRTRLAWAKNKEMDLAGYRVYRRLAGQTFPARPVVITGNATTTATDTPPATGETFVYELRAVDRAAHESVGTADLSVVTVDRTPPAVPSGVAAAVSASAVTVRWTAPSGAATYRVQRAAAPAGPWTTVVESLAGAASYRDLTADFHQQQYYRIAARDTAGNLSAYSATATTGAPDTTAPAPVTGLTAQGTTAGNRITWTAPATTDTAGYEVFAAPAGQEDPDGPEHVTGTSYHDVLAETGAETVYQVRAVDHYGNLSAATEVSTSRPTPAAVPAPLMERAAPSDLHNEITFRPGGPDAVTGYRVYRRSNTSSAWTPVDTTAPYTFTGTDRGAPLGRAYYYVVALDADGNEGPPSATAETVRDRPVLTAPLSAPSLTVVQDVRIAVVVDVKPADADRGKGITGYEWSFSCTDGGRHRTTGETARIQASVPYAGPCDLWVRAIGHYGSTGTAAYQDFFWTR
ncbi:fibronectin type III domain-containing protein [Streptomyces sp. P9-A4]|uniref:fibronectin type III domain-containing protein n=1 Tax=Streptomyces sp. P9-A4 TaxID=3072285 RepID=UPI002FC7B9D1